MRKRQHKIKEVTPNEFWKFVGLLIGAVGYPHQGTKLWNHNVEGLAAPAYFWKCFFVCISNLLLILLQKFINMGYY